MRKVSMKYLRKKDLLKYCLLMDIMMINNSLENKTPPN